MDIKKKRLSLKIVFLEYLFIMALAMILAFVIPYTFFTIVGYTGLYTYANYSETEAKKVEPKIASAEKFDSNLVPASCKYAYLNKDFNVVESNMDKTDVKHAVDYVKGQYHPSSPDNCYLSIERKDGYCVLHYYIKSQYTVAWMARNLPSPDRLLIAASILNSILTCFIVTTLFAKSLKKQLQPLLDATEKIKEKDLDFEIQSSGIKEFNHILVSISDMKSELKHSLEQQWRMEQIKKDQTSALAHDIKTPLAIIRGNADLLNDTKQTGEQQEYTRYILKNAGQMEQYIKMLINLTQAEAGYEIHLGKIRMDEFINEIADGAKGLSAAKQQKIQFCKKELPQSFTADAGLLQRAIMNVVSNAVDYSPEYGKIIFTAEGTENYVRFCIADTGKGFSKADLKQATTQFYMGDSSRNLKNHFGIGLYVTESIVKLHKGILNISNSAITGGGQVAIEIPYYS